MVEVTRSGFFQNIVSNKKVSPTLYSHSLLFSMNRLVASNLASIPEMIEGQFKKFC